MTNQQETWQVSVNNQIYETNLEEMREWIGEGALLPQDKVRRGNLRWLEAGKVPLLFGCFNAKELGLPLPVLQTTTDAKGADKMHNVETAYFDNQANELIKNVSASSNDAPDFTATAQADNFEAAPQIQTKEIRFDAPASNACFIHPQDAPQFVCDGCANFFCKACPQSFGSSVKICPLCGAMCKPVAEAKLKQEKNLKRQTAAFEGFGFEDIGCALAYPFRYKTSFVFGAVMFMFFTLGQSASSFGGIYMMFAAIFCLMLANALTFGVLTNTIENFAQGETDKNFMPDFEDFSLCDSVVHPFFLSVGTYLVSFGFLAVIVVGAIWYAVKNMPAQPQLTMPQTLQTQNARIGNFASPPPVQQINAGNQTLTVEKRNAAPQNDGAEAVQQFIDEKRKADLESIAGKSPETRQKEYAQMFQSLAGFLIPFALLAFLATLWGVFYFPAACCVAGYTQSFAATINPLVGLDTIKHLGVDYAKLLATFIAIGIFSLVASAILGAIFSPFDMPQMGNLPVKALGGFITFYFSIVFSVCLGFALYKNYERLNLYRG